MSLFGDLFGSETTSTVNYLPQQIEDINRTNDFRHGTVLPQFKNVMDELGNQYAGSREGVLRAGQNLAGVAGQAQETQGGIGEGMARMGSQGLSNLFSPQYAQQQLQAALAPGQAQYQTNLANQAANFGGAGNLGSARQALAGQQLAGQNEANQFNTAANLMQQIEGQRQQVGQYMTGTGLNAMDQAVRNAQMGVQAAQLPYQSASMFARDMYGVPAGAYTAPYPSQQSTTQNKTDSPFDTGMQLWDLAGGVAGIAGLFSDERLKENIKHIKTVDGIRVYSYNYRYDDKPQVGVMAQELLKTKHADAVMSNASGYYTVNYSKLPTLH